MPPSRRVCVEAWPHPCLLTSYSDALVFILHSTVVTLWQEGRHTISADKPSFFFQEASNKYTSVYQVFLIFVYMELLKNLRSLMNRLGAYQQHNQSATYNKLVPISL